MQLAVQKIASFAELLRCIGVEYANAHVIECRILHRVGVSERYIEIAGQVSLQFVYERGQIITHACGLRCYDGNSVMLGLLIERRQFVVAFRAGKLLANGPHLIQGVSLCRI